MKDVVSSVESLIDLCLAMVTYDQGRYERCIPLFDKVFSFRFSKIISKEILSNIGSKWSK